MQPMQSTLKNRTIFCRDNLEVLRGIDDETIDLVYLDPPFNKKKQFTAPIGTTAEGASFHDYFRKGDIKEEWLGLIADDHPTLYEYINGIVSIGHKSNKYYLCYMAIRLIELRRVLKPTGGLYLHCDQTMSHYLKLLLDCVFGERNFKNEIIWWYGGGGASKKQWGKKHDVILYCVKGNRWTFNAEAVREQYKWSRGQKRADGSERDLEKGKLADDVFHMHSILPWAAQSTGYPTQKPLALLERLIKASSNEGDLVLDPFCGCATTCVAAEKLNRQWIGIDISKQAYHLVKLRLNAEVYNNALLNGDAEKLKPIRTPGVVYRDDIPARTDDSRPAKPIEIKHLLFGSQEGKCAGCQTSFDYRNLTLDHIVPQSKGGGDNEENPQLLCHNCNSVKGARDMLYLKARLREAGII